MKLSELIEDVKVLKVIGKTDIDILDIAIDSKKVNKDSLFLCLNGENFDGHNYIKEVERYGAIAIVTEREMESNLTQIVVEDSRIAMTLIAKNFYDKCDEKMKIIGVIGTNGKTTTTHFITSILSMAGISCGLIGTLGVYYGNKYLEPTLTTPDPISLYKIFSDMYASGVEVVVMEVSAHAVFLKKVYGLGFEVSVFTNFSEDHLDFFKSMENYEKAKMQFFIENKSKFVVTNTDDSLGIKIKKLVSNSIGYGVENPADVFAIKIKEKDLGVSFVINLFDKIYDINLDVLGYYNVYNAMAAATACALIGIKTDTIAKGLMELKGVEGRLELIYNKDYKIYVDYAHTPDGLEKTLVSLKKNCVNRLISIFGCGGNRDKNKRKIMGEISGRLADFTIVTSDNPRYEEPMDIIYEIESGVIENTKNYVLIQNREEAIKYAIDYAEKGDIILVAGKGSEKYQEIFGIKHIYNDKDTIREILSF